MTSPAEQYAAFRRRERLQPLNDFAADLPFDLDSYQRDACEAVLQGKGVLVAAPTGAGKTVVATFAVTRALQDGRKAFYTTPIKALSNQKYREYLAMFGPERVGLLTGDVAINPRADLVIMTTEVLRNMMYANSPDLDNLSVVILDEVHYLADRFRGPVWEEVLIQLPAQVQVVSLSATVSNAEEFGAWLAEVRGQVEIVVCERRPVPLWQHVMTRNGLVDLYIPGQTDDAAPRLNPELAPLRAARRSGPGHFSRGRRHYGGPHRAGGPGGALRTPPRPAVIEALDREALLPAIFFVFSRAGCDDAVARCREVGLRLTDKSERDRIREIIEAAVATIPGADLDVLGYQAFLAGAEAGFAPHHAGMLPVFKQAVEVAFGLGLIKAVFATETLALGINMPARTVAMDRLDKWNGSEHAALTPGEYTQLTGRAGRRGIDIEGHAVVVVHRDFDPEAMASLASKRTYPLRSAFRPTYNMAINLIERVGRTQARDVLELSFAQFQADRAVVGWAREVRRYDEAITGYEQAMVCDKGDFAEYAELRRRLGQLEKQASRASAAARAAEREQILRGLKRGDIVRVRQGKYSGTALILDTGTDGPGGPGPLVLTERGPVRRLAARDLAGGLEPITWISLPKRFNGRDPQARRQQAAKVAAAVRASFQPPSPMPAAEAPAPTEPCASAEPPEPAAPTGPPGPPVFTEPPAPTAPTGPPTPTGPSKPRIATAIDAEITEVKVALAAHPCHRCPDRETHARWAGRLERAHAERAALAAKIEGRTTSVARQFDRVCQVLEDAGYIAEQDGKWHATPAGRILARIYAERDILIAQGVRTGVWDALAPADLAGVVTALVFETKEGPASSVVPDSMRAAVKATNALAVELGERERHAGVPVTEPPDTSASTAVAMWARGEPLARVIDENLSPGDFVRLASQLLDVLDQIADVAPNPELRSCARQAFRAVRRGVVLTSIP